MNFHTINRGVFRRLHKYFSYQTVKKNNRNEIRNINKKLKCRPLTKTQKKEIKSYYASFGFKNVSTEWHRFKVHITGNFYKEHIPLDLFYNVIEPNLNMDIMFPALTDKNLLEKLYEGVQQPKTIVNNVNGLFIDANNNILELEHVIKECKKYNKLVIKPSIDSGGGKNVIVFEINGNNTDYKNLTIEEILERYDKNFIVQKFLEQHEQMSLLNPSSLNSIRVITLLINGQIEILATMVRMGSEGSRIDNIGAGGIFVRINPDGTLDKKGYNLKCEVVSETYTKVKLEGFRIPSFNKIIEDAKRLHKQMRHFKLISWDLAIDKHGETVLLEYNIKGQGVFESNGPFFGEFTDQVLKSCQKK